jgi:hypothetical protein
VLASNEDLMTFQRWGWWSDSCAHGGDCVFGLQLHDSTSRQLRGLVRDVPSQPLLAFEHC